LGRREEYGHKTACDQVKELLLRFIQVSRRLPGWDDGVVIRDFSVVEDSASVRLAGNSCKSAISSKAPSRNGR
jgi:hypothetical protein